MLFLWGAFLEGALLEGAFLERALLEGCVFRGCSFRVVLWCAKTGEPIEYVLNFDTIFNQSLVLAFL